MDVKWLAKFVLEELSLLFLFKELLLKQVDLAFQIWDALSLLLRVNQLSLVSFDEVDKLDDVIDLLLVVDFTLFEGRLLDFDLLVKKMEFFVSFDELGA